MDTGSSGGATPSWNEPGSTKTARRDTGLLSAQMGTPLEPYLREAIDYEATMARKYERAAWSPWLSVEPDPTAPPGAGLHGW